MNQIKILEYKTKRTASEMCQFIIIHFMRILSINAYITAGRMINR